MPSDAEPLRPVVLLQCVLAATGVFLFFTSLDMYAFASHRGPAPSHWIVAFGAAILALWVSSPNRPSPVTRSPVLAWIGLYFIVTSLWAFWMRSNSPVVMQVLWDRYRSIAFLLTLGLLFGVARARRVAVLAIAAAVVLASVLNVAETAGVLRFTEVPGIERFAGRSAGLYVNPNRSGTAIVLGLANVLVALPRRARLALLIVGSVGVAATFSRGALGCLSLLYLWLLWRNGLGSRKAVLASVLAFALVAIVGGGGLSTFLDSRGVWNEDTSSRLRLDPSDEGIAVRGHLALKAWNMFLDAPLIGNGLGASFDWDEWNSSHNTYLNLAVDHGIVGMLLFPALGLALLATTRRSSPFPFVLLAAGFASHNLLQEEYVLLSVALAATDLLRVPVGDAELPEVALGGPDPEPLRSGST